MPAKCIVCLVLDLHDPTLVKVDSIYGLRFTISDINAFTHYVKTMSMLQDIMTTTHFHARKTDIEPDPQYERTEVRVLFSDPTMVKIDIIAVHIFTNMTYEGELKAAIEATFTSMERKFKQGWHISKITFIKDSEFKKHFKDTPRVDRGKNL